MRFGSNQSVSWNFDFYSALVITLKRTMRKKTNKMNTILCSVNRNLILQWRKLFFQREIFYRVPVKQHCIVEIGIPIVSIRRKDCAHCKSKPIAFNNNEHYLCICFAFHFPVITFISKWNTVNSCCLNFELDFLQLSFFLFFCCAM